MQNDTFKRLSKDLQGALSIPGNFFNKQAKKLTFPSDKKKKGSQSQTSTFLQPGKTLVEASSFHDVAVVGKSASVAIVDDNKHCLSVSTGKDSRGGGPIKSPPSTGPGKAFPKEEPPIIHCPPSVSCLERFSPQRQAWIQNCCSSNTNVELHNVLKSGQAWDTIEDRQITTGYNNPNEATGLFFVKRKFRQSLMHIRSGYPRGLTNG